MTQSTLLIDALATPVAAAFSTASTGGSLVPATYYYRVSAINASGESLAFAEASQVVGAGTSTNTVTVNWTKSTGATGYKVYGRTTGAELLIATVGDVATYVDTGSITPAGALPTANTSGGSFQADSAAMALAAGAYGRLSLFVTSGDLASNVRATVYQTSPGADIPVGELNKQNPSQVFVGPGNWFVRRRATGAHCGVSKDI